MTIQASSPPSSTGRTALALALAVSATLAPWSVQAQDADQAAIEDVLARYRTAVSTCNEPLFLTTLLSPDIPFYAVVDGPAPDARVVIDGLNGVADFRARVFNGGRTLSQTFDQIEIEREGGLAQVSLRFETRVRDADRGSEGWKTLILVKVAGGWKIASELYTVRALAAPDGGS